jgi:hypothetical protein
MWNSQTTKGKPTGLAGMEDRFLCSWTCFNQDETLTRTIPEDGTPRGQVSSVILRQFA